MIVNVIEIVMFLCFEWLFIGLIVFVWVSQLLSDCNCKYKESSFGRPIES